MALNLASTTKLSVFIHYTCISIPFLFVAEQYAVVHTYHVLVINQ